MNKLRDYVGIIAICATSVIFTGCGDDDNDQGPAGPVQNAPDSLANKTYTLTDSTGATSTLAFNSAGDGYTLTPTGGTADNGTFTGQRAGDTWTVQTASGSSTNTSTVTLNFTGATSGNYQLVQGDAAPVTGTFAQSNIEPPPGGGNNTNTNGTVQAPASLSSITVTANGNVTRFDFSGGTTGTFNAFNTEGNSMGSGNFTYTPSGTGANLHLTYPGVGAGDEFDDLNMVFTQPAGSGQPNTFTGTQKIGINTSPYSGTFTY